ncbi:MAG: RNA polymerase sigma factor [Phycisphaerales bacterium]
MRGRKLSTRLASLAVASVSREEGPEEWLREHGDAMWAFAMSRLGDAHRAEEAVQETLLAAWLAWQNEEFRAESSVRTWLLGILRHKASDIRRKQSRRREGRLPEMTPEYDERGMWLEKPRAWSAGGEGARIEDVREALHACLHRIPTHLAEAFVLREVHGKDSSVICAALGITRENLWVRLHRARTALRRCVSMRLPGAGAGEKEAEA